MKLFVIVLVHACGLLFRRLWQHDRKVKGNDCLNIYIFYNNRRNVAFILLPQKEVQIDQTKFEERRKETTIKEATKIQEKKVSASNKDNNAENLTISLNETKDKMFWMIYMLTLFYLIARNYIFILKRKVGILTIAKLCMKVLLIASYCMISCPLMR